MLELVAPVAPVAAAARGQRARPARSGAAAAAGHACTLRRLKATAPRPPQVVCVAASAGAPAGPAAATPHKGNRRISELTAEDRSGDGAAPPLQAGVPLARYSTWEIGGPARLFAEVTSARAMAAAIAHAKAHSLRHMVLGKGSNCLFDDRGFDGLMLLNHIEFLEDHGGGLFRAGAGVAFNALGLHVSRAGWSGLEFASGIPGSVGGAVYMNAGADGQETGAVVHAVEVVGADGAVRTFSREAGELPWSYRKSRFQTADFARDFAITAVTFALAANPNAKATAEDLLAKRKRSQPLSAPSAGCVFRNPGNGAPSAGALIDRSGLKGLAVGSAAVSAVHANFLVNSAGLAGKAADVLLLIQEVKAKVKAASGLELQEEVMYIPFSADEAAAMKPHHE